MARGQDTPSAVPEARVPAGAESAARGGPPAPADERTPLSVLVTSSSASVPREAFLEALRRTLRRPLLESSPGDASGEELSIRYDEQARELMVSCYDTGSGPVTRVIEAPSDPRAVPEAAALLAENLCAVDLAPPPSAPPPSVPPPSIPAAVAVPVAVAPAEPAAGPPSAAPAEPAPEPPVEHEVAVVGALYPFATNYRRPDVHANFEFNLIYGRVGGLEGIGLGTIHYVENDMSGLLAGGMFSVVGKRASGLLISGLATSVGSLDPGLSVSLLVNHAQKAAVGGQVSFGMNFAGSVDGAQFAGLGNVARGPLRGVQASFASNVADSVEGMQVALVNVAGDVAGMQLGLINVGARVRGTQVGLVNVSDDVEGVPFGLFNVSRSGGVHIDSWFSTTTHANLGVKFATRYTYTMLTFGYHREEDLDLFGGGLVVGWRIPVLPQVSVAVDVGGDYLLGTPLCCYDSRTEERIAHTKDRNHYRLRVLPTWQVQRHFALFAGPAAAMRVPFALYSDLDGYDQDVEFVPEFDVGFEL